MTTDGTTLLGADDKAGISIILTAVEYLLSHPEIPHGKVRIAFTPDEEIGRGPHKFDVKAFGADVAYTIDGGRRGELQYENFISTRAVPKINSSTVLIGRVSFTRHCQNIKNQNKVKALKAMFSYTLLMAI